jgi:hypothetical protein
MLTEFLVKKVYLLVFVILFVTVNNCSSSSGMQLPKDEGSISSILKSKGYRINTYGWKPGKKIESVGMDEKTKYTTGDFESICSIPTIKQLYFENVELPKLGDKEIEACTQDGIESLHFTKVILDQKSICSLSKRMSNRKAFISFGDSQLNDPILNCVSGTMNLDGLAISGKSNLSELAFCEFTQKSKDLSFLVINDVQFSKKTLECIFSLPSLTRVTLQGWTKVSEQERFDFVAKYEKKYGRKIQSIVDDPTTNTY